MTAQKRIAWIDCCKGFAMLLVILGHSLNWENPAEKSLVLFIYSFHMPLFFILSCFTATLSQNSEEFMQKTFKSFKHLIVPAFLIYALDVLIKMSVLHQSEWKYQIERFIYASGCPHGLRPFLGMSWFLFALFFGRTILDFLQLHFKNKALCFAIFVCTLLGIFGLNYWCVFSIDIALSLMPFFYCGYILKGWDFNRKTKQGFYLSFCGFLFFLLMTYNQKIAFSIPCRYFLVPLCYLTGIFGTLFFGYLFKILLQRIKLPFLSYLGKNTLTLFLVHFLEYTYTSEYIIADSHIFTGVIRIIADIIILFVINKCYFISTMTTKRF